MAETLKDVNPEVAETSTDSSEVGTQQETNDSEVVENSASDIQRNLRIALQKERERRKAAESQLRQVKYEAPKESNDEIDPRFLNVEAMTLINNKLLIDPSFKDRADLVQNEMIQTGKSLEDADNAVIARLFKDMLQGKSEETVENKPIKQIKTQATPEQRQEIPKETQAELDMFDNMAKSFGK